MTERMQQINGSTRIYGIMGSPVSHSLSPAMHNAAFAHLGLNAAYVPFAVKDLAQAVAGLRGLGVAGASVTIPFKEAIIPLLDALGSKAAGIGAVNTVVCDQNRLRGHNTDWLGAVTALKDKTAIKGEHFLLLGAGGAARAIVFGLLEEGAAVSVTDLDPARARALALEWGVEALALKDLKHCPARILINATPVGMAPGVDEIPIEPQLLDRFDLVMDIVYQPLTTRLLREAQGRGAATIDGLQMLIHQATAQFELFTGEKAPLEVMSRAAYAALEEG